MRTSVIVRVLLAVSLGALALLAQGTVPSMKSVEPMTAKAGDELTVTGENLGKTNVAAVFLTDGTHDFKVAITEQEAATIKVKVAPNTKPGRLALMVLTTGKDQKYIEQPVKVTIEE